MRPGPEYYPYHLFPDEKSFTSPRPDCPNPERWHAADWDSTEFEVLELVAAFARALQPETVIETGSAFGYGSQMIGRALKANGHGKLYSLEFNPERAAIAKDRVVDLPVTIVEGNSLTWTPPTNDVGFAFFDSYPETRAKEFLRYLPYMVKHAIVAFHDTGPHHAVWPTVVSLESQGYLKPIRLRTPRGVTFAEVLK